MTPPLIRDPADWARDWGWVSRVRRDRAVARLRELAEAMRGTGDEGAVAWAAELEDVARYLTKNTRKRKVTR